MLIIIVIYVVYVYLFCQMRTEKKSFNSKVDDKVHVRKERAAEPKAAASVLEILP